MPRRKRTSPSQGIGVGLCSLCTRIRVCAGELRRGGIRYCAECVQDTLGWRQITAAQQAAITQKLTAAAEDPAVRLLLAAGAKVDPRKLADYAQGEALIRLRQSERTDER